MRLDPIKPLDTSGYTKEIIWCGPTSLALLTDIPLVEATEHLTRIQQKPYDETDGVWAEEIIIALRERGYSAQSVGVAKRYTDTTYGPTLKRFMRERTTDMCANPMLIEVDGHVLVSHFGSAGDNWTKRMISFADFPKAGRLVKSAWIIRKD